MLIGNVRNSANSLPAKWSFAFIESRGSRTVSAVDRWDQLSELETLSVRCCDIPARSVFAIRLALSRWHSRLASRPSQPVAALHALPMLCKKDFVSRIAPGHFA